MEPSTKRLLKKLDDSFENWRKLLLTQYKEGASDREVMTSLRLSPGGWDNLRKNVLDTDFNELVTLGRLLSHAWWEKQGRLNLHNPKFQTALYKIQMQNRFGWSEKTEQSLTNLDLSNKDDASLLQEIKDLNRVLGETGRDKGMI